MMNYRTVLYHTVAVLALGGGVAAAHAQESAAQQDSGLEEIVVTAQRRSENLQNVPLSVTALTALNLERSGITNSRDLGMVTPGLRVESVGPYIQPSLRGITTTLTGVSNESSVATYVDGVYQPSLLGALYNLPDVQQVEVLKGPQGTLFGRNAIGGAIQINTLAPDLNTVQGKVGISYSSFDTYEAKGTVSVPLIPDRLATSVTAMYKSSDGYVHNLAGNDYRSAEHDYDVKDEEYLVRGKIRFVPWEGADFVAMGLYTNVYDTASVAFTSLNGNSAGRPWVEAQTPDYPFATGTYDFAFNTKPVIDQEAKAFSLRGTIEAGPGTITTTSAYNSLKSYIATDADNSLAAMQGPPGKAFDSIDATGKFHAFSQEILYNTKQLGRFRGTLGAFYFQNKARQDPVTYRGRDHFFTLDKIKSFAIFGEGTYDITDQLALTGGLRYSWEKRNSYWTTKIAGNTSPRPDMSDTCQVTTSLCTAGDLLWKYQVNESWDAFTPRVSVKYKVADRTNVYATYSKGFKSGTFNPNASPVQLDPVNPEKADSYEIGVKSDLTSALRINAAAFYYDYKDLQVTALEGGSSRVINAAKAEIKGLEVNADWQALDGLKFGLGATYLDAKYKSFPHAALSTPKPAGGNTTTYDDVSGNRMIRAPKLSGNLNATYSFENSLGAFALTGVVMYSSRVYYEPANRVSQPDYAVVNLSGSWRPNNGPLEIKLWTRNLTNKDYIQSTAITSGGDEVLYAAPRSVGMDLNYKF